MKINNGFFVVIDGIDGCGKSTQLNMLFEYIKKLKEDEYGVLNKYIDKIRFTSEPSREEDEYTIMHQLTDNCLQNENTSSEYDALLFALDRIYHCDYNIKPDLEDGCLVICDRYRDSSYVYQFIQYCIKNDLYDKRISTKKQSYFNWLRCINQYSIEPDLTIIIDIKPEKSLNRKYNQNDKIDKFEKLEFQKKIRKEFLKIANYNNMNNIKDKHIIIDGNYSKEDINNEIISIIKKNVK